MRLVVTLAAEEEIREASDWWQENRSAAPGLFRADLQRAFELITQFPEAAPVAATTELAGVRRVLLRRVGYHLYYRVQSDSVEVLGFWHSTGGYRRGRGWNRIMKGIQYVVDPDGTKRAVIIDLTENAEIWEDFYDTLVAVEREDEPRESLEKVRESLRSGGAG